MSCVCLEKCCHPARVRGVRIEPRQNSLVVRRAIVPKTVEELSLGWIAVLGGVGGLETRCSGIGVCEQWRNVVEQGSSATKKRVGTVEIGAADALSPCAVNEIVNCLPLIGRPVTELSIGELTERDLDIAQEASILAKLKNPRDEILVVGERPPCRERLESVVLKLRRANISQR